MAEQISSAKLKLKQEQFASLLEKPFGSRLIRGKSVAEARNFTIYAKSCFPQSLKSVGQLLQMLNTTTILKVQIFTYQKHTLTKVQL